MNVRKNYPLFLILVCLAIFFVNLESLPVNIMEARNFITAREMLTDNNWIFTTINGGPRYQKPPLPTWLTAFSGAIFGIKNVWALRLPAAIMALALIWASYLFSKKVISFSDLDKNTNGKYAFISSLVMATSFYIVASARDGQWDIYTHSFMMMCIYQLFLLFTKDSHQYQNAFLAALFFGCSFLSKGPVSFYALLLPFLLAFGIVYKYKNFKTKWVPLLVFLVVAFLISGSWHWYTFTHDPVASQISKSEAANWASYEIKPFYYYWSFFTQSGVWTLPAFIALLYPYLKKRVFDQKAYRFTFLWTILSVVLLSLIPEKKSRYLLPVLIPMALNTAFYIDYLIRRFKEIKNKKETFPVYFSFGLIGVIGIVFPIGGYFFVQDNLHGNWIWFILLSVALFIIGFLILRNTFRRKMATVFYLIIAFIISIIWFGLPLANSLSENPDYKTFAQLKSWATDNDIDIYEYSAMTPELLWDYGEKMSIIKNGDSLALPSEQKFGVLVSEDVLEDFKNSFDDFRIEPVRRYDMNFKGRDSRSYRSRLSRDLFIVEKKVPFEAKD